MRVHFTSRRAFTGFRYDQQPTGNQVVIQVSGKLRHHGKQAEGKILILDSPNTDSYCTTLGFDGWRAERKKGG